MLTSSDYSSSGKQEDLTRDPAQSRATLTVSSCKHSSPASGSPQACAHCVSCSQGTAAHAHPAQHSAHYCSGPQHSDGGGCRAPYMEWPWGVCSCWVSGAERLQREGVGVAVVWAEGAVEVLLMLGGVGLGRGAVQQEWAGCTGGGALWYILCMGWGGFLEKNGSRKIKQEKTCSTSKHMPCPGNLASQGRFNALQCHYRGCLRLE